MPNHVRNVLKFKNLKPDDVANIVHLIASPIRDDIETSEIAIDFDKIIPEPKTIDECPAECLATSDSHIESDSERPWFNWYEWHVKHWGTKWGAYDCYTKVGKTYIQFVFSTAWSCPVPIIERLRLMGYEFELKYADEDLGNNCGKITFSSEQGFQEETLKDSYTFARNLWARY